MAKNMQPVAKRCKALGISPAAMGYDKRGISEEFVSDGRGYSERNRKKVFSKHTAGNEPEKSS